MTGANKMMRASICLAVCLILCGIYPSRCIGQNPIVQPPEIHLTTSCHMCANNNNCDEGFHVSDQIVVRIDRWSFGEVRDNCVVLLCGRCFCENQYSSCIDVFAGD